MTVSNAFVGSLDTHAHIHTAHSRVVPYHRPPRSDCQATAVRLVAAACFARCVWFPHLLCTCMCCGASALVSARMGLRHTSALFLVMAPLRAPRPRHAALAACATDTERYFLSMLRLAVLCALAVLPCCRVDAVAPSEFAALTDMFAALGGPRWRGPVTGWLPNSSDPCTTADAWTGITCDAGAVV
jgi:hypothetical protein